MALGIQSIGLVTAVSSIHIKKSSAMTTGFLCPHDDSQGALRFAPVSDCPSVSVHSSRFMV